MTIVVNKLGQLIERNKATGGEIRKHKGYYYSWPSADSTCATRHGLLHDARKAIGIDHGFKRAKPLKGLIRKIGASMMLNPPQGMHRV